jgi:bifunctional oligoribonuclease and PAP phosphatase NrnA
MNTTPLDRIVEKIADSRSLAVTSHLRPDGDSICTSLAIAFAAEAMGKTVDIINKDWTPVPFRDFPDCARIRNGQIPPASYDAVILLECADVSRSGQEHLDGYFKINIDHHYSNDRYADINWVEPTAAAVGEMGFALYERLPITLTPRAANHLYCAIVSDTGSFQFSNTTAAAFATCHKLVQAGADPLQVSEAIYHNYCPEKIKLIGRVLSTLTMNAAGDIAVISMFKHDLDVLHLSEIDTEDITTLARSIRGVSVVLFFKEMEPGMFRVSIRSKGGAHAAAIAEHFGGGGHAHAAGFTAYGSFEDLSQTVPATIEGLLRKMTSAPPSVSG